MIPGLRYLPAYLAQADHDALLATVGAPTCADPIVGVTLGSACVMEFARAGHATEAVLLEPGSALAFSGDARHEWQHAIPARTADDWHGQHLPRSRRVSLTFRKMLAEEARS